jgi:hypothetical protein
MKTKNLKLFFNLFLIILSFGYIFITLTLAEELKEAAQALAQPREFKDKTRIIISASGPAKFGSFWLDNPPRLVIEFQTKNIISKIDNEVEVNQEVIKKITSTYFGEGERKTLKTLTFELTQKVPYELWQEGNTILLDIQTPQEISLLSDAEKEIFTKGESREVTVKRLVAMEAALKRLNPSQSSTEVLKLSVKNASQNRRKNMGLIFLLIGLSLIAGLGVLAWWLWYRFVFKRKEIADLEITELKHALQEKNKVIEQKEIIYKAVEQASLQKEKEYGQIKSELEEKDKSIRQQELVSKKTEEELSQKEKELQEVKDSFESLKEVLIKKGEVKELTMPEEKGKLWIPGRSPERRSFSRLDLTRDYNRTIILRIESEDKTKSIKSFANNIGLDGLCFETRSEFNENQILNLRLFFFGDKVPMMRIKARIIWKKVIPPVNHYGVSFISIEEKDKTELSRYIESKILK